MPHALGVLQGSSEKHKAVAKVTIDLKAKELLVKPAWED